MAVPLYILDAADIGAGVHKDPATQNAAVHTPDPVADVRLRANLDAVVAVDQCDVLDGVVTALQMERPRIRVDVPHLLFRIEYCKPADGGGVPELEQRRRFLVITSSRGQHN